MNTIDDIPEAVRKACIQGLLSKEETGILEKELVELLSDKQIAYLFSGDVHSWVERDLLIPGGEVFRPDRVSLIDGRITVIEYKTGQPHERHNDQLKNYHDIFHRMGFKEVDAFLIYIDLKSIRKIA